MVYNLPLSKKYNSHNLNNSRILCILIYQPIISHFLCIRIVLPSYDNIYIFTLAAPKTPNSSVISVLFIFHFLSLVILFHQEHNLYLNGIVVSNIDLNDPENSTLMLVSFGYFCMSLFPPQDAFKWLWECHWSYQRS